jgi:hypothetical protein
MEPWQGGHAGCLTASCGPPLQDPGDALSAVPQGQGSPAQDFNPGCRVSNPGCTVYSNPVHRGRGHCPSWMRLRPVDPSTARCWRRGELPARRPNATQD